MLIEGKYITLETEDYGKAQSIVNYMDWVLERPEFKEEIKRQYDNLILYGTTDIRWPLESPRKPTGEFK